ncbi:hypothetical protein ACN24M_20385 [Streptomyces microflavus]
MRLDPKPGGGCGARFVDTDTDYVQITDGDLRRVRPDLPTRRTTTPPLLPGDPGPTTETHMQIDRTADTVRVTLTAEEAEAVQGDLGQIWANKISAAGDQLHSLLETPPQPA